MTPYKLPDDLEIWIEKYLNRYQHSLQKPGPLAKAVLAVSKNFQSQESTTPWQTSDQWAAYIGYYLPLNYIRSLKVIDEAKHWDLFDGVDEIVDFGCGPGTFSKALAQDSELSFSTFSGYDIEGRLGALYLDTPRSGFDMSFKTGVPDRPKNSSLLVSSYTLNELSKIPDWLFNFKSMIIVEPSTKQAFPRLLELRKTLMEQGYQVIAPCPHSHQCPLQESKKDWCHDRVLWEQPEWFQKLENQLPIKNRTLTYSYLIATKKQIERHNHWRVVGDSLIEKGKTRWMICRSDQREFLSHLKRHGEAPHLSRGDRIFIENCEAKGNEIRFDKKDLKVL